MLKEQLTKDIMQAMKDKDVIRKGVLQLVKAQIEKLSIQEGGRDLTREEEIQIVQREIKQTKESLADAEKYERPDLVEMNKEKVEILTKYLPKQFNADEVKEICINAGIVSGMKMGEAMKIAMPKLSRKTENALISKTVKELIK